MAAAIPVTVISGYLGAGKTTLVNHLLRNSGGRRLAVAVNEFGDLPIDPDLIVGAEGDVLTLAGGCICCSFGSDLVAGLGDLAKRGDAIDHILIEASGVALPAAIAQSLTLVPGLALDAIIVVVDAETVRARAGDRYLGDTITRQLADADIVIVNKTDLAASDALDALGRWLATLAPRTRIVTATQAAVAPEVVLGIATSFDGGGHHHRHAIATLDQASFTPGATVDANRLAMALADATIGLVRAKGFVRNCDGDWTLIQVVGQRHAVTRSVAPRGGGARLVCIAHGCRVDRARIERLLAVTCLCAPTTHL